MRENTRQPKAHLMSQQHGYLRLPSIPVFLADFARNVPKGLTFPSGALHNGLVLLCVLNRAPDDPNRTGSRHSLATPDRWSCAELLHANAR